MAHVAASSGKNSQVMIWARDKEAVKSINEKRSNPKFCPEKKLAEIITATTDPEEALRNADLVMGCLPTQITPKFLESVKSFYPLEAPFLSCSKGLFWLINTD